VIEIREGYRAAWVGRHPAGDLRCRPDGAVEYDTGRPGVTCEVVYADGVNGYVVEGGDGRFRTTWTELDCALSMAHLRQKIRCYPVVRSGCWQPDNSMSVRRASGPRPRRGRYSTVAVNGMWFAQFGYSTGSPENGYRRQMEGHRASFIAFNGRLPVGGTVDHHCKNPPCVNPGHLGEATSAENVARELPGAGYGVVRKAGLDDALAALAARFNNNRS